MPAKDILFGEYQPDKGGDPQSPGYLVRAENIRPVVGGYMAVQEPQEIASAATIGVTPLSCAGFSVVSNARHYAGSSIALYESNDEGVTWNDNSKGGGYIASTFWDFELFGDAVIAVNGLDNPQAKSVSAAVGDNFADLAGTPPIAGRVAKIRDHLVLGRLSTNAYAIQTSAIGDHTDWPTIGSADALAKQSIFQEFPRELGAITQVVGGEKFGLVFQSSGITRMTYIGGDIVYQIDTFEKSHGTTLRGSVIRVGAMIYYLSPLGAFRTDGYAVQNISAGRVEESLIKDLMSTDEGVDTFGRSAAYDSRFDVVMWPFEISSVGYVLCYHIKYERFTVMHPTDPPRSGTLYSVRNAASEESAEELPYAFNSDPKLMAFTDTTDIGCTMQTGFIELMPGYVTQVDGVQMLGVGSTANVLSGKASLDITNLTTAQTGFTAASDTNRSDIARLRQTGRYHAFKFVASAGSGAMFRGLRIHYRQSSQL